MKQRWLAQQRKCACVLQFGYDHRFIQFPNGDYKAIITAIKVNEATPHDFVIQLQKVANIADIEHVEGIPKLVVGKPTEIVGANAQAPDFQPDCKNVPSRVSWNPLAIRTLPVPGNKMSLKIFPKYYQYSLLRQQETGASQASLLLAREMRVGSVGVIIQPNRRAVKNTTSSALLTNTKIMCAVQITAFDTLVDPHGVDVRPLIHEDVPLPPQLASELRSRFGRWARITNQPGWFFITREIEHAPNDRAMVFNILRYLDLPSEEVETLLVMPVDGIARALLAKFPNRT